MRSHQIFSLVLAISLALPMLGHAVGLNAWHYSTRDDLTGPGDAAFSDGKTRYTPDLSLTDTILAFPDFETQRLLNTTLDEVFLQITFKAGITPNINKLVEIRYGTEFATEFAFTPGSQPLFSQVVGQDLLVWYGFQDSPNYSGPTVTTESAWSFTVAGDHPVAQVQFFISSHRNGALEMPDLLPLDYNHLYLLPEQVSQIAAETTDGQIQGKPLRSAQKLIVLVHGWNPDAYANKFAPDDINEMELSPRWVQLASNLVENPVVQQFGWTIARYDWSRDAATGGSSPHGNSPLAIRNHGNASRDAGSAHGAKLGKLVAQAGATHVQFITFSSGAWVARRAAAYLKHKNPSIQIQITALDPNVNDDDPPDEDDINLQPAFELTSLWTDHRDNLYVVDGLQSDSLSDAVVGWTSGNFSGWNNADIEYLPLYDTWMQDHAGPISWYARSVRAENLGNVSLLSAGDGFVSSLPVRLASPNDNFPGNVLFGANGNTTWFNYQATAQSFEPAHSSGNAARRSVWGQWTAPASGTVTFDTFGGDFYNVLAAYTGNSLNTLNQIAHDYSGGKGPGQCQISFNTVAGQTYSISVDGILGGAGQSPLHWQMSGGGPTPTVTITAPASGATVSGSITVSTFAIGASKVEFYLDGVRQLTDTAAPFLWSWNTASAANGPHTLTAKSYSGATLLANSPNVSVTVNNSGTPPACADATEPNDSSLTATMLAVGGSASGYICSATDVDWFKVTLATAGTLTFNLTLSAQNDYDLELYGPNFNFLKGSYRDVGENESVTVNANVPGTYYARVYGYPVGNGSFNPGSAYSLSCALNGTNTSGPGGTVVSWGQQIIPYVESGARFTAIATAGLHNLALKSDGTVVAWGHNAYGQSSVPAGLGGVIAIADGAFHSLALKRDGTVVAWGDNRSGKSTVPTGLTGVVAIAAGPDHSLALRSDGTVVAWGDNHYGQSTVPEGLSGVTAISAGGGHSLAVRGDGTVVAWGNNQYGQSTVPEELTSVMAVAAGGFNSSLALKSDGTVVAWGSSNHGTVPAGLRGVVSIAAGGEHNLALKSDGTIVAWGFNDYGQSTVPPGLTGVTAIAAAAHSLALKSDGTMVAWGRNVYGENTVPEEFRGMTAIAAGGDHSLALKNDGTVVSWGLNLYGQLPVPAGLRSVAAISAGWYHSLALKSDGTVVAWGRNEYGESTVPTGLSGVRAIAAGELHSLALKSNGTVVGWGNNGNGRITVPAGLSGVMAIAVGRNHNLALKSDGTIVAWGYNGNGRTTVPAGLSGVTAIAAGEFHNLALKNDGTVVAWGYNNYGQSIVRGGLSDVTAIAAGWHHSLALKSDGTVVAWGRTNESQSTVPTGLSDVTVIAAGGQHSLALVSDNPVSVAPSVQVQPQSQTISIGQSLSFTVAVGGTPPFTYQWFRNSATIAGATSATLTLFNVQPAQAGSYTVQITGPGGSVTSTHAVLSFVEDSNNNSLPDAWEITHGLPLNNPDNASADPDHDGTTNREEYLAGTDPQAATSVFRVTATQTIDSSYQIAFTTVSGKTYRVERAPSPSGPWTLLEGNLPGTGSPLQVNDSPASSASRFYRIRTP